MDHSVSTKPAASSAASSSRRRWVLATSMCSLACLFLLSAGILLATAGYRPFQPRAAAAWDRFSRVQQKAAAPAPSSPPLARPAASHHAAPAPAPDPTSGSPDWSPEDDEEEDAGPPALAPAPSDSEEGEDDEDTHCDLFDGEWVEEPAGSYPLYDAAECPFLSDQVACRRNGRPDSGYERWRWQPRGCGGRTRSQASFHLHCIASDGIYPSIP